MAYYQQQQAYQQPQAYQLLPQYSYPGYQQQVYPPQPPPAPVTLSAPPGVPRPPASHAPVAFTAVAAKAPPSAPKSAEKPGASQWPSSLKAFVERAFAAAKGPEGKAELQGRLKELIGGAQRRGELWSIDWENQPLPTLGQQEPTLSPEQRGPREHFSIKRNTFSPAIKKAQRNKKRDRSASPPPMKSNKKNNRYTGNRQGQAGNNNRQGQAGNNNGNGNNRQGPPGNNNRQGVAGGNGPLHLDQQRESARARRFGNGTALGAVSDSWQGSAGNWTPKQQTWSAAGQEAESWDAFKADSSVRGTCQAIEKSYFRLTSKPDAALVRPEHVLQQALQRLVGLLRRKEVTYFYAADQFKGMRQDCTVQHLQNEASAAIYEAHARCALEHGDMAEFNQCQAQLLQHYKAGIVGCRPEFTAYRVIHQSVHAGKGDQAALLTCLQSISPEDAQHPFVRHALQVRQALALGDSMQVCLLYSTAPHMGRALLDIILPKVRFTGLKTFAKAHLPHLPVSVVATRLGFVTKSSALAPAAIHPALPAFPLAGCTKATYRGNFFPQASQSEGEEDCRLWLEEHGAVCVALPGVANGVALDCKASLSRVRAPERSAPAATGPDLALDDFLARAVM